MLKASITTWPVPVLDQHVQGHTLIGLEFLGAVPRASTSVGCSIQALDLRGALDDSSMVGAN